MTVDTDAIIRNLLTRIKGEARITHTSQTCATTYLGQTGQWHEIYVTTTVFNKARHEYKDRVLAHTFAEAYLQITTRLARARLLLDEEEPEDKTLIKYRREWQQENATANGDCDHD